jgi:hypothetical protein
VLLAASKPWRMRVHRVLGDDELIDRRVSARAGPARCAGSAPQGRSPARAGPGATPRSGGALILGTAQFGNLRAAERAAGQ